MKSWICKAFCSLSGLFVLNYISLICHRDKIYKFENLQILEGVTCSTQIQSSGLVAHEKGHL